MSCEGSGWTGRHGDGGKGRPCLQPSMDKAWWQETRVHGGGGVSKWHRVVECKEKTRGKKRISDQESCESKPKEFEVFSVGNGERKTASEGENDSSS